MVDNALPFMLHSPVISSQNSLLTSSTSPFTAFRASSSIFAHQLPHLKSTTSTLFNSSVLLSLFSRITCALLCIHRNHNWFPFNRFRTLCQKHPGWGYAMQIFSHGSVFSSISFISPTSSNSFPCPSYKKDRGYVSQLFFTPSVFLEGPIRNCGHAGHASARFRSFTSFTSSTSSRILASRIRRSLGGPCACN
jgi:hypothetical protein